jgi:trigger factor
MENQATEQLLTSDLIELTVHRKPNCLVEFVVKARPPIVQNAYKKAIKSVAKETTIPGFRKGKAPDELITRNFSSAVEKQWSQKIGDEVFRECELLAKIPVLNSDSRINFNMKSHSLDDGAEMTFQFESEPQVPSIDFESLHLQTEDAATVDQKKIDDILYRIRLFFSKWQSVTDRPVQMGDFIIVDLDTIETDTPDRVFSNTRLEVGDPIMAKWMRDIVIGMNVGESKDGVSEPDETASDEDKATFKPKKVRIAIKSIEEPQLPLFDDDLAKKVGVETSQIMLERLTVLLNNQLEEERRVRYRDQISTLLLTTYVFDVPGSLLHHEMQHRLKQLFQTPSFKNRYESLSEEEKKQEIEKVKTQAEEALRLFYLCKSVATSNRLTISASDLNLEINTPLDAMFADRDLVKPNKTDEEKNLLMSRLLLTKAQDFIIDKILG